MCICSIYILSSLVLDYIEYEGLIVLLGKVEPEAQFVNGESSNVCSISWFNSDKYERKFSPSLINYYVLIWEFLLVTFSDSWFWPKMCLVHEAPPLLGLGGCSPYFARSWLDVVLTKQVESVVQIYLQKS